jgi:Kyakuja-Dileera-Zisupton transposase
MNMDYSLCQALKYNSNGIRRFVNFYDVNCQHCKNFLARVLGNPYLSIPPEIELDVGIGDFHIHGHQVECFTMYSSNFIPGIGQVDGEVVETLWSQLNEVSGSTRTMSTFHRRETLDDHMNDSNWKKLTRMAQSLCRKLRNARQQHPLVKAAYDKLTASADPDMIEAWEDAEKHALENRTSDRRVMKIFDVNLKKGLSFDQAR